MLGILGFTLLPSLSNIQLTNSRPVESASVLGKGPVQDKRGFIMCPKKETECHRQNCRGIRVQSHHVRLVWAGLASLGIRTSAYCLLPRGRFPGRQLGHAAVLVVGG